MFFSKKKKKKSVTFATCVYEKDWKQILLDKDYLEKKQISNHLFPFDQKVVVINNIQDYEPVIEVCQKKVDQGLLTDFVIVKDRVQEVLEFFGLKKSSFTSYDSTIKSDDWIFNNSIAPLTAIYSCKTDYLLYHTGDAFLAKPVSWIEKAIELLEKKEKFKVANLSWNENYQEVEKESYKRKKDFFLAKRGFSDQLFLVKREDFQKPIYGSLRKEAAHYPWGELFEKRVFSHMLEFGWERIIYSKGSYTHENF